MYAHNALTSLNEALCVEWNQSSNINPFIGSHFLIITVPLVKTSVTSNGPKYGLSYFQAS